VPGIEQGTVFEKIAVYRIELDVVEMIAGIFARQHKEFIHEVGFCENRRAHVEPVAILFFAGAFATRKGVGFKYGYLVSFVVHADGGCQSGYPGANYGAGLFCCCHSDETAQN